MQSNVKSTLTRLIQSILVVSLLLVSAWTVAATSPKKPCLNQVIFPMSAEQWVTTQTARVTVTVNATLDQSGLAKLRADVMSQLSQIAKSDQWHITQLSRQANQAGLEQVLIVAQARLPETAIADIRERAKQISKPGQVYKIDDISYQPSFSEQQAARAKLRGAIYVHVQAALTQLNRAFPDAHYFVHRIEFSSVMPFLGARPMAMREQFTTTAGVGAAPAQQPSLQVSQKMTMTAQVTLAARVKSE